MSDNCSASAHVAHGESKVFSWWNGASVVERVLRKTIGHANTQGQTKNPRDQQKYSNVGVKCVYWNNAGISSAQSGGAKDEEDRMAEPEMGLWLNHYWFLTQPRELSCSHIESLSTWMAGLSFVCMRVCVCVCPDACIFLHSCERSCVCSWTHSASHTVRHQRTGTRRWLHHHSPLRVKVFLCHLCSPLSGTERQL